VNYTTVSDGRLKTHVTPVASGLTIVNQLNPVFYDWNRSNPKASSFEDRHQVGFIAQEVEKVLPEVVNKGEDGYLSLEYGKIVSVVVAAVQELDKIAMVHDARDAEQDRQIASKAAQSELEALKAENSLLRAENARKSREMEEVKSRLDRIERMLDRSKILPASSVAQ
jgi:predicted RNase H-like nuclease (RuvC/YqgF family)